MSPRPGERDTAAAPAPPRIVTDPGHGGRWTSLTAAGREWLWHRPEPRRARVAPGDAFADAGGLEECVPTVRGTPDHGDAWTRSWRHEGPVSTVDGAGYRLTRTIRHLPDRAEVHYELSAAPGFRFLWAAHALLDTAPDAHLEIEPGAPGRLYEDGGAAWTPFAWPTATPVQGGPVPFDRLGPDDGTALGAIVAADRVRVHDRGAALGFALDTPDGHPLSVALWRNLGGFPEGAPYRSTGVEPMLGRVFDLAAASPSDAATVPASGRTRWRLTLTPA